MEEEENENEQKIDLESTKEHIESEIAAFLRDFPLIDQKFVLTDKIGEGAFSSVFRGYYKNDTNRVVALKRIYFTSRPSRVENEIRFLLELGGKHNIIKMIEGLRFKDEVTLVLEYFEHSNFKEFLKTVTIIEMQLYLRSLFESLTYIHMLGVVHHDIKPSNFLYNAQKHKGVLVDFGLAQYEKKVGLNRQKKETTINLNSSPIVSNSASVLNQATSNFSLPASGNNSNQNTPNNNFTANAVNSNDTVAGLTKAKKKEKEKEKTTTTTPNDDQHNKDSAMDASKNAKRASDQAESEQQNKKKKTFISPIIEPKDLEKMANLINPNFNQPAPQKPIILVNDNRPPLHAPRAGTRGFRAPEILWKDSNQTVFVDIWSAGVVILTLLTKRYPFFHSTDDITALAEISCLFGFKKLQDAAAQCSNMKLSFYNVLPVADQPVNWKELCFKLNPELDPSIPDSAFDLLSRCLCLNPNERISAKDAYCHPFLRDLVPQQPLDTKNHSKNHEESNNLENHIPKNDVNITVESSKEKGAENVNQLDEIKSLSVLSQQIDQVNESNDLKPIGSTNTRLTNQTNADITEESGEKQKKIEGKTLEKVGEGKEKETEKIEKEEKPKPRRARKPKN